MSELKHMPELKKDYQQSPPKDDNVKSKHSGNPFVFTEQQLEDYGPYSMDTPIARAWARADLRGHHFGPSQSKPEDTADGNQIRQFFLYAVAHMNKHNNSNDTVTFSDGRGIIYSDSGL